MKRTLILLLSLALLLSACQPAPPSDSLLLPGEGQGLRTEPVEVERETSTPPPTQTPIPTPTPHPAFVDLQSRLADLGLTLLPDGTIETTADGGRRTVPNLLVSPEGIISLTLKDGTVVTVAPKDISVDEAGGLKIKGYEWDSEQGGWVEAISEAIQAAMADFDKYGYDYSTLTFGENEEGKVIATNEDGRVVYENGLFDERYAVEQAGQLDLMPTDIEPRQDILKATGQYYPVDDGKDFVYFMPLFKRVREQFEQEYGYDPYVKGKSGAVRTMLNPEINAWGNVVDLAIPELDFDRYLYYELADGTIHIVPLR